MVFNDASALCTTRTDSPHTKARRSREGKHLPVPEFRWCRTAKATNFSVGVSRASHMRSAICHDFSTATARGLSCGTHCKGP